VVKKKKPKTHPEVTRTWTLYVSWQRRWSRAISCSYAA